MTHQFTAEQIEAVTREVINQADEMWLNLAVRLILEARAERDEWKHKADLELRRCDLFEGYLAATKAQRDAALARVREQQEECNTMGDGIIEQDKHIASLEAENARLKKPRPEPGNFSYCEEYMGHDLWASTLAQHDRIAENERLRVRVEDLAKEETGPALSNGVQWDDKFLARDLLLASDVTWPPRAAMEGDHAGLFHDTRHKEGPGRAARSVKVRMESDDE